jgi:type II secretory pathway component PulF
MQAERTSTLTPTFAHWAHRCREGIDRLRRLKALSSVPLWAAVLIEVTFWLGGAYIAYWQVPESVAAIRSHGVEAPRSMIRALNIADWIYGWWWFALPLIAAGIVIPKLVVFSKTQSRLKRTASLLAGWAVPLLFLYYLLGTPAMLKLGIWP